MPMAPSVSVVSDSEAEFVPGTPSRSDRRR